MRNEMRSSKWMFALLAMTMTSAAQQPAPAPLNLQRISSTQPSVSVQPQTSLAPPATMDQAVDRVILREKELVKFLAPRTPLVETYLQNLIQDLIRGDILGLGFKIQQNPMPHGREIALTKILEPDIESAFQ